MSTTPPQDQPTETTHTARGNTYRLRRFTVTEGSLADNPEAVQWNRAVYQGFHDAEPTDEATRRILRSLREAGATVLGASNKAAALAQADRVVVLVDGEVADAGPWRDLAARWCHLAG